MSQPTTQTLASTAHSRGEHRTVELSGKLTHFWFYPASERALGSTVLVHGYRGNHRGLEAIAGAIRHLDVYIPDLPGFGASVPLEPQSSLEGYANWLTAFVARVSPEATVVGHSFGSIVVAAATERGLGNRLVLINPVARYGYGGIKRVLQSVVDNFYWLCARLPVRLGNALCSNKMFVWLMSSTLAKTQDKALRSWIHNQHFDNFSDYANLKVALEGYRASTNSSVVDFVSTLTQPVLLIAGECDDITSLADEHRLYGQLANSRLEVLPRVGHLVHYEQPARTAALIEEFCQTR